MDFDERYRKVSQRMWTDGKFVSLSKPEANGRYLWLYLLTGPSTCIIPGLFRASHGGMADDLDWSLEAFDKAFAEVLKEGLVKEDREHKLIYLPKAIKHNPPASPNVLTAWAKEFYMLPECDLRQEALLGFRKYVYEKYSLTEKGKGYVEIFEKAFAKSLTKSLPKLLAKPSRKGTPHPLANQEQDTGTGEFNNINTLASKEKPLRKPLTDEDSILPNNLDSPFGEVSDDVTPWPEDESNSDDIPDDEISPSDKLKFAQEYWQEKGMTPECRLPPVNWTPSKSSAAIKNIEFFEIDDIRYAIDMFKIIKDNKNSYKQYDYSLEVFLASGIQWYVRSANPLETQLLKGAKKINVETRECPNCSSQVNPDGSIYKCSNCGYDFNDDLSTFRIMKYGTEDEKKKAEEEIEYSRNKMRDWLREKKGE